MPEQLNRFTVTPAQAKIALGSSRAAQREVLQSSLDGDGRVKGFRPDVAGFFGYRIAHDAHHRGQFTMLARQAGHAIPQKAMFGMWEWACAKLKAELADACTKPQFCSIPTLAAEGATRN